MSDDDYQVCTFLICPADCSRINARFGGIQFANLFHHRNGCAAHKRVQCCRLSQDLQRERFIISKCLSHHNICKGNIHNSQRFAEEKYLWYFLSGPWMYPTIGGWEPIKETQVRLLLQGLSKQVSVCALEVFCTQNIPFQFFLAELPFDINCNVTDIE